MESGLPTEYVPAGTSTVSRPFSPACDSARWMYAQSSELPSPDAPRSLTLTVVAGDDNANVTAAQAAKMPLAFIGHPPSLLDRLLDMSQRNFGGTRIVDHYRFGKILAASALRVTT